MGYNQNEKKAPSGSPRWFKAWFENDYLHLTKDVQKNTRLLLVIWGSILASALAVILTKMV